VSAVVFGFLYGQLEAPVTLPKGVFVAKPYLQLGEHGKLAIVWQAVDSEDVWKVQYRTRANDWKDLGRVQSKKISVMGMPTYRIFHADATVYDTVGFDYQILRNDENVFKAHANPRIASDTAYSFVVFGDAAEKTDAQRSIAFEVYKSSPNFVIIVGDVVYEMGRAREYLSNFFPIYNCDAGDFSVGAPLMRSTLFVALPGNHDMGTAGLFPIRNLDELTDGLAYFYEWCQPENGPAKLGGINIPTLIGNAKHKADFLAAAKSGYPGMTNFFFDKGNARFIALDANDYMDWTDKRWRDWLEKTLADAKNKTWRLVFYHQSAFSSDPNHSKEQRMRLLADIFQRQNVQLVFSGHAHNYQRTYPLQFKASGPVQKDQTVAGQVKLAENVPNPAQVTNTGFVTYITTGAGGATLSGAAVARNHRAWKAFTKSFIADVHSYTLCQVQGDTLVLRQISETGKLLDELRMKSSGILTSTGGGASSQKAELGTTTVPLEPFPQLTKKTKKKKILHRHNTSKLRAVQKQ